MSKSPQVGYNHNIPHRGRLYHIQTEDSGQDKAHIFTHVFFDGTIIASNKVSYSSQLETSGLERAVVALMQESHKTMIRRLRKGEFDEKIENYIGIHPDTVPASGSANADLGGQEEQEEPVDSIDETPVRLPSIAASSSPVPIEVADALSQPISLPRNTPPPRPVMPMGRPLREGKPGPAIDPTLMHPSMSSQPAQAHLAKHDADAKNNGNSSTGQLARGPARGKRRVLAGIGGPGSKPLTSAALIHQRDMIIGKFGMDYDKPIDDDVSRLVQEDS